MSKKTSLVEAILKLRKKENDLTESKHLYTLTNQQLEKIYNSESKRTEQEVLNDFEKLGYIVVKLTLNYELHNKIKTIYIHRDNKEYSVYGEEPPIKLANNKCENGCCLHHKELAKLEKILKLSFTTEMYIKYNDYIEMLEEKYGERNNEN